MGHQDEIQPPLDLPFVAGLTWAPPHVVKMNRNFGIAFYATSPAAREAEGYPELFMTDDELQRWWPDLGIVLAELRRTDQPTVADLLVGAVRAGASSSEILGGVGAVLRNHYALRSQLSDSAAIAWDAVMADVHHAFPGSRFLYWLARLTKAFRQR